MRPIICFIGLDGSGKSTSIEYAAGALQKQGLKTDIVRAAYVLRVVALLVKTGKRLLLKKNSNPYKDYKAYLEHMRRQAQKGLVYRVFSFLTTCEFRVQIFFNIRVRRWLGRILLVDRYIYDNAVTYAVNLGLGEEYIHQVLSRKWKRAPKPDLIIYIKTPVDVCCSRKSDIPDPLYLEMRAPLYDLIAASYNVRTISGSQPLESMLEEIMSEIQQLLNNRGIT
jgi:thymidylate kinase